MEPGLRQIVEFEAVKWDLMSKLLLAAFSFALLALAGVTASQAPQAGPQPSGIQVLEFHARNCQKCHGEEGELRSPGWADSKSAAQMTQILSQMVTEQAGHAPLNEGDMAALSSYHRAANRLEPWANLIAVSGRTLTFETTRDARLSATAGGKKVPTVQAPKEIRELAVKLLRWTLVLPASAELDKVVVTTARGEGKAKKVVTWKLSDSSFSNPSKGQ